MYLNKIKSEIRKKILSLFKPINYINFFSKKKKFNFIIKKIRNLYLEGMAHHDLVPIQKVNKIYKSNNLNIDLFIDTHDFSSVAQVMDPDWEVDIFDYYKTIKGTKNCFIDLGGNIGCHSLFFLNFLNFEKIIYVEPNEKCYELFKKSLSIQDSLNISKVLTLNKSISENTGTSTLKFFKNNSGSGSSVDYFGKKNKSELMHQFKSQFNYINSQNITFNELFENISKDYKIIIKMDIQGYEPKILLKLSNLINKYNISHCFFEVNEKDENIMIEALKMFEGEYLLKDLNNKIIQLVDLKKFTKRVILLEKIQK
tara:strand:+ start:116 stop:1054 length:939 start_codon:yes stop_codon:yes gene_type:complete